MLKILSDLELLLRGTYIKGVSHSRQYTVGSVIFILSDSFE